jgi:hypothetical protein
MCSDKNHVIQICRNKNHVIHICKNKNHVIHQNVKIKTIFYVVVKTHILRNVVHTHYPFPNQQPCLMNSITSKTNQSIQWIRKIYCAQSTEE